MDVNVKSRRKLPLAASTGSTDVRYALHSLADFAFSSLDLCSFMSRYVPSYLKNCIRVRRMAVRFERFYLVSSSKFYFDAFNCF